MVANLHHNAAATAETAVALLLAAAHRLVPADRALRRADWGPRYAPDPSPTLAGRRGVVVGHGAVGSRVARALLGLGMSVDAVRRTPGGSTAPGVRLHAAERLEALLPGAAAVVLCAPLTDATRGLFDRRLLALLGSDAVLVNVARGEIVVETALYEALATGRLGAAGIDVWWRYPEDEAERSETPPSAFPFGTLDNVVLSPHRAGHGADIEMLRARALVEVLAALARGEPLPGRVDLERGY